MRTVQIRGYCPYSAPLLLPRSWIATKKKGKREYQTWIQTSEWRCGCVKEEDICGGFLDHYLGRPGPERYGGVGREMRLPAHLALEHGYFQRSRLSVVPPPCTFLQYHYLMSHFVYRFWVLKRDLSAWGASIAWLSKKNTHLFIFERISCSSHRKSESAVLWVHWCDPGLRGWSESIFSFCEITTKKTSKLDWIDCFGVHYYSTQPAP